MSNDSSERRAFTLIELLVVVAVIALLLSLLLPSLSAARARARTTICLSNGRQIAQAWMLYVADHRTLPGSTNDYYNRRTGVHPANPPARPVNYQRFLSLDWLGTIGESGNQTDMVPSQGTIFPYVGEIEEVYSCPEDRLDVTEGGAFGNYANPTKYSYTSSSILTGAPPEMLKNTIWTDRFEADQHWSDWSRNALRSTPWLFLEEDESEALAFVTDSAWGNQDRVSDRHQGGGLISQLDGSAIIREFQKQPVKLNAWRVYYELTDGRILTCGYWYDTRGRQIMLGYLRGSYVNGVIDR